jgi:mono/diheme cytochrome c family protein
VRNPANQKDEWLREATRILGKVHGTTLYREGPNLLPNSGFETAAAGGLPEGWSRRDNATRPGNATAQWSTVSAEGQFHSGKNAVRIAAEADADTGLNADVPVKPNTMYRLGGWMKTQALNGRINLSVGPAGEWLRIAQNANNNRVETDSVRRRTDWTEVEVDFNSGDRTSANINLSLGGRGEAFFDDLRLVELLPSEENAAVTAGDAKRGEQLFLKHPAACILCHSLKGQGSSVGPALDGIATRGTPAYIHESLLEPSKVIAKGYEQYGKVSPMPPMGDIFNPQEISDLEAFLQTLK